jgi:demethylmenaquinone methyltransferase/2-methoxy-6-polyprenyl-1,4-benzoquinol methylase
MPDPASRSDPRFAPHAGRDLGEMFSEVSPRYDQLNAILSLGQDRAWRRALWAEVPEGARVVLDVCCGNGVSLSGLRRPGRLLLGMDSSRVMLLDGAERFGRRVGGPWFVRADGFHLPLAGSSVDAITIAFGLRNLRPRPEALRELARVLRPGGVMVVLEAAPPRPGLLAPLHHAYLRFVVPLVGMFSPDPGAYRYLARSILEFGDDRALAPEMSSAGLELHRERSFLAGASRLWVARRRPAAGQSAAGAGDSVQAATEEGQLGAGHAAFQRQRDREWRLWRSLLLILDLALLGVVVWALASFGNFIKANGLTGWPVAVGRVLLWGGLVFAVIRAAMVVSRLRYPPEER